MKTLLLLLYAAPLFALSPPLEKPGDSVNGTLSATAIITTIKPDASYANGWTASYLDGWTIHEFHRRADELENDGDQAALDKIWEEIKTQASDLEACWSKLSDEQKTAEIKTPFWKRDVGLPRRLSRSQSESMIKALGGIDLVITKQEAADLLKALEIFAAPEPSEWPNLQSQGSVIQVNAAGKFIYPESTPDELRKRADWLESVNKAREQRRKDLAWARAVLETWRGKVKEAGG